MEAQNSHTVTEKGKKNKSILQNKKSRFSTRANISGTSRCEICKFKQESYNTIHPATTHLCHVKITSQQIKNTHEKHNRIKRRLE
jgi:hypothetical protein